MGECSAYISLQANSKVKFAAWPMSCRPPDTDRLLLGEPRVKARIRFHAVDESSVKLSCVLLLFILYYYFIIVCNCIY